MAHCSTAARRVDESLGAIKGGWVRQKWALIKLVFLIEVECSSWCNLVGWVFFFVVALSWML
jgi:hypothetical protein